MGPARAAGLVRRRGIGSARRQLQVGRDEAVRGAGRLGRDGARARRQDAPRHALLQARVARRAVAQAPPRAARDEPRPADAARQRRHGALRRGADRTRGAGADDREARRRLPGVHPALHRRVHVPPEQHEPDHRRADDPLVDLHPPGRVRRLARRRDDDPVAHRDARGGRSRGRAPGRAPEADARGRRHRRAGIDRLRRRRGRVAARPPASEEAVA